MFLLDCKRFNFTLFLFVKVKDGKVPFYTLPSIILVLFLISIAITFSVDFSTKSVDFTSKRIIK